MSHGGVLGRLLRMSHIYCIFAPVAAANREGWEGRGASEHE